MVRIAFSAIVLLALTVSGQPGISNFSDWSAPVNLGPVVNSTFAEGGPAISKNGLSLYFHSERPGGYGSTDIWVSQRANRNDPWGPPAHLGPAVNTAGLEAVAALSRDEHLLFFSSDRPRQPGIQRHLGLVPPARARSLRLATGGQPRSRRQFGVQRRRPQLCRERRCRCAAALLPQQSAGWCRGNRYLCQRAPAEWDVRPGESRRGAQRSGTRATSIDQVRRARDVFLFRQTSLAGRR